jgi:hypothetical protein
MSRSFGVVLYREIDDGNITIHSIPYERPWSGGGHFTEMVRDTLRFIGHATTNSSGGFEFRLVSEDYYLEAIHRCTNWMSSPDD